MTPIEQAVRLAVAAGMAADKGPNRGYQHTGDEVGQSFLPNSTAEDVHEAITRDVLKMIGSPHD